MGDPPRAIRRCARGAAVDLPDPAARDGGVGAAWVTSDPPRPDGLGAPPAPRRVRCASWPRAVEPCKAALPPGAASGPMRQTVRRWRPGTTSSSSAAAPRGARSRTACPPTPRTASWCSRPGARLPVGRVHPHAGRPHVPDRQPLLRLEVRVRARAAHERPPVYHARGKVLGGSSSINGMIFQREPARLRALGRRPRDAELGLRALPPLLPRMENALAAEPTTRRGHDGPLVLERGPPRTRCSARSSRRRSRPATSSPTT